MSNDLKPPNISITVENCGNNYITKPITDAEELSNYYWRTTGKTFWDILYLFYPNIYIRITLLIAALFYFFAFPIIVHVQCEYYNYCTVLKIIHGDL